MHHPERQNRRRWAAATVGGALAATASWLVAMVGVRWLRAALDGARFAVRLVTLTAYRRCPDCFRVLRQEATVCRSCGSRTRR
ncbi:hypothetical protein [Paraconexibacter sp. AEG42_29]|uniref:hypothetical protein n=1 Tax=Paraconexibacter sp. AEG42_29 TaxID=2997339 RepID=UPI00339D597B